MRFPTLLRLTATATALGVAAGFLVGTVAGAGTPELSKATVQTQAAKILASETGQKLPKVACASGVAAKVGAVIHCTVVPHGMTIKYPVTITVRSVQGNTAHFYVQVGQATGQANRAKFCADNATITKALTAATTEAEFLTALQANEQTILDLQSSAPAKIVARAGTLIEATRQAVQSGNAAIFNTKAVAKAAIAIDSYCGQSTGG
jgi:hypothetical protein